MRRKGEPNRANSWEFQSRAQEGHVPKKVLPQSEKTMTEIREEAGICSCSPEEEAGTMMA